MFVVYFAVDNSWKLPKSTERLAPSFPGTDVVRTHQVKSKVTSLNLIHNSFPVSHASLSLTSDTGQWPGNVVQRETVNLSW